MVRAKYRYIVAQIRCNHRPEMEPLKITSEELYSQIKTKIHKYYGDYGISCLLRLNVKYFNEKTHMCIIQATHGPHRYVTSTLPLMTVIGKEPARFRILYVGATVKQCNKFIVNFQEQYINKMVSSFKNNMERTKFMNEVKQVLNN
uniref:Ribonuclease P/MRP protein subunit POP5 n=1 Tax=Culicoides sonorensis TaxID=179676 RepID=A0A336LZ22_CULSO